MSTLFKLEIMTPDKQFFSGDIESLIVGTPFGDIGILYNSVPMVTIVKAGVIRMLQKDKWLEAANGDGFLESSGKRVVIMAEFAEWAYEANQSIKPEIDLAELKLRKEQSIKEYKIAKAQLARQFARLKLKSKGLD